MGIITRNPFSGGSRHETSYCRNDQRFRRGRRRLSLHHIHPGLSAPLSRLSQSGPETWNPEGGKDADTEELMAEIRANSLLEGVTFSGGEPFAQPAPLLQIAREAHAQGLDVWSYTGYVLDELIAMHDPDVDALLNELDVLVDGPFVIEGRDLTLRFRGSRNQRVIDMNATRERGEVVLKYND